MRLRIKALKHKDPSRPSLIGTEVTVRGWIRTIRNQKTFSFIEVNDGSTLVEFSSGSRR